MRHIFLVLSLCFCISDLASAQSIGVTWRSKSVDAPIEAKFVSKDKDSVTLKKDDGSSIDIKLSDLDEESLEQAEKWHWYRRTDTSGIRYAFPNAAAEQPIKPFPNKPTLQEWKDHIVEQLKAGHPEVLWQALPEKFRKRVPALAEEQPKIQEEAATHAKYVYQVGFMTTGVLVNQEEFVRKSPLLQKVPPVFRPILDDEYASVAGVLHEASELLLALNQKGLGEIDPLIHQHGPRVGVFLKRIIAKLPPPMVDQLVASISVEATSPGKGRVTIGPTRSTIEMVFHDDRWIPASTLKGAESGWVGEVNREDSDNNAALLVLSSVDMMNVFAKVKAVLADLNDADSQAAFDKVEILPTE